MADYSTNARKQAPRMAQDRRSHVSPYHDMGYFGGKLREAAEPHKLGKGGSIPSPVPSV